jgi:HNH endonuclease
MLSMPGISQLHKVYDPPGKCIYCGCTRGPFGEEHIIPRALGGALVFKDSSCKKCEHIINSQIEAPVLNMMAAFRHRVLPARGRDKKRRPKEATIEILDNDDNIIKQFINPSERPRTLFLPQLPPPALLNPSARSKPVQMWMMMHRGDLNEAKQKWGGVGHVAGRYDMRKYTRFLAKIAHGFVAAERPAEFAEFQPLLPDFILGDVGDGRALVGGELVDLPPENTNYRIGCFSTIVGDTEYIVAFFRLLAFAGAPLYQVVVAQRGISQVTSESTPFPRVRS